MSPPHLAKRHTVIDLGAHRLSRVSMNDASDEESSQTAERERLFFLRSTGLLDT